MPYNSVGEYDRNGRYDRDGELLRSRSSHRSRPPNPDVTQPPIRRSTSVRTRQPPVNDYFERPEPPRRQTTRGEFRPDLRDPLREPRRERREPRHERREPRRERTNGEYYRDRPPRDEDYQRRRSDDDYDRRRSRRRSNDRPRDSDEKKKKRSSLTNAAGEVWKAGGKDVFADLLKKFAKHTIEGFLEKKKVKAFQK